MTAPCYYSDIVDLRVEAIITSALPRLLWLQLSGLLYPHNNSWQVTNLHLKLTHLYSHYKHVIELIDNALANDTCNAFL